MRRGRKTVGIDGKTYTSEMEANFVAFFLFGKHKYIYDGLYDASKSNHAYDFYLPEMDLFIEIADFYGHLPFKEVIEFEKKKRRAREAPTPFLSKEVHKRYLREEHQFTDGYYNARNWLRVNGCKFNKCSGRWYIPAFAKVDFDGIFEVLGSLDRIRLTDALKAYDMIEEKVTFHIVAQRPEEPKEPGESYEYKLARKILVNNDKKIIAITRDYIEDNSSLEEIFKNEGYLLDDGHVCSELELMGLLSDAKEIFK